MIDGIKAGENGLRLLSLRLDTAAANLANASTAAYKKDEVSSSISEDGKVITTTGYVNYSQGELVKTSNPLDIALEGDGFFAAGQGDEAGFTRDGRFTMDAKGKLVTAEGLAVQGKSGPIILDPRLEVQIANEGTISQNGRAVGKLKLVRFENPGQLIKAGKGVYTSEDAGSESKASVRQGFVENSNVSTIEEMASLMKIMRNFDSVQKGVVSQDSATGKLIASMGKF